MRCSIINWSEFEAHVIILRVAWCWLNVEVTYKALAIRSIYASVNACARFAFRQLIHTHNRHIIGTQVFITRPISWIHRSTNGVHTIESWRGSNVYHASRWPDSDWGGVKARRGRRQVVRRWSSWWSQDGGFQTSRDSCNVVMWCDLAVLRGPQQQRLFTSSSYSVLLCYDAR